MTVRILRWFARTAALAFLFWWASGLSYPLERHFDILAFDPLVALSRGSLPGIVTWAAIIVFLALPLFVGRAFCGWICPVGTLAELGNRRLRPAAWNRAAVRLDGRWRYGVLAALLLSLPLGGALIGYLDPNVMSVRLGAFATRVASGGVWRPVPVMLILVVLGSVLFMRRAWCRKFCPIGALLSLTARFRLSGRRVEEDCTGCGRCVGSCPMGAVDAGGTGYTAEDCISCLECQVACPAEAVSFRGNGKREDAGAVDGSRRRFLHLAVFSLALPLALRGLRFSRGQRAILRPPGAVPEDEFNLRCLRCHECIKVCPTGALQPVMADGPLDAFWTPKLVPRIGRCELCFSCSAVCPAGVIQKIDENAVHIGEAVLDRKRCLGWSKNQLCIACVEQCPVGALRAFQPAGRNRVAVPLLHHDLCIGCGACENCCPLKPPAVTVVHKDML